VALPSAKIWHALLGHETRSVAEGYGEGHPVVVMPESPRCSIRPARMQAQKPKLDTLSAAARTRAPMRQSR
jgi:hypothetical protein